MVGLEGVLAKKIFAIVIAVGGTDDGVNVVTGWDTGPVDRDRLLVIELDQDDGALDAIIKHAVLARATDPGEPGLVQVFPDFGHLHLGVSLSHVTDVDLNKGKQSLLSFLGKFLPMLPVETDKSSPRSCFHALPLGSFQSFRPCDRS